MWLFKKHYRVGNPTIIHQQMVNLISLWFTH